MQKKVLSFLLAGLLVLSLCIVGIPHVSAAQNMQASDACVELIKSFEGFRANVFLDYSQYSIGYGTACDKDDYPNGITEAEAERLLRRELAKFETSINQFASRYGLNLSQQQFDALASFTYNLGPNWMNNASTFRSAVLDGARGNDFVFAITQWSNAGGYVLDGLARRRLAEANLYLDGQYSKNPPSNYRYVLFDNNMTGAVSTIKIQGYDASLTDAPRANPTKSGYKFVGWYTQPDGGTCVTRLDASTPGTLYAHWQTASGEDVSGDSQGHAVNYKVTVTGTDVNIRTGPGTDYSKNGKAQKGQQLQLTWAQPGGPYLWGQFDGGWICLDYTDYEIVVLENSPAAGVVTAIGEIVDTDTLRIRERPTTSSSIVGTYYRGDRVNITLQYTVGAMTWGKTDRGWISLEYVKLTPVEPPTEDPTTEPMEDPTTEPTEDPTTEPTEDPTTEPTEDPTTEPTQAPTTEPTEPPTEAPTEPKNEVIATGKIVDCDSLRIREGAGTRYKQVGSLTRGTKVSIFEIVGSGSQRWARMNKGWISMNYVQIVKDGEEDDVQDKPENEQKPVTGYVVNCDALNIRSGAGTRYSKVGKLPAGTKVTVLETKQQGSMLWGRIKEGWISMDYIQLGEPPSNSGNGSAGQKPVTGYVVNCDAVNIRAGAGTKYDKVGKLPAGTKVTILETKQQGVMLWGRIEDGWISMDYVQLGDKAPASSGSSSATQKGYVVNCDELNVRAGAGTKYDKVGTLPAGTNVTILETKQQGVMLWGRIDKGWISMDYVQPGDKAPASSGSSTTRAKSGVVINASEVNLRKEPGTSSKKVGTAKKGDKLVILETRNVGSATWGRTEDGWIHMHYVKLDSQSVPSDSIVRTVTASSLKIRSAPGTSNREVGTYAKGTQVVILEQKRVGSATWGRTAKGWIHMHYVE